MHSYCAALHLCFQYAKKQAQLQNMFAHDAANLIPEFKTWACLLRVTALY